MAFEREAVDQVPARTSFAGNQSNRAEDLENAVTIRLMSIATIYALNTGDSKIVRAIR